MRKAWRVVAALGLCSLALAADGDLLRNGRFEAWEDETPSGWTRGVGAQHGEGPWSRVAPGEGGTGLVLSGDAATKGWWMVGQDVATRAGTHYRLAWTARGVGLRLDPGQRDNGYVGIRDASGIAAQPVVSEDWTPEERVFRAASDGAHVLAFLSKSGRLEVREISLDVLRPEDSFDVLVRNMGRYYPSFVLRGVDWPALAGRWRPKAQDAKTEDEFASVVTTMLKELKDLHVHVRTSDGTIWVTVPPRPRRGGSASRSHGPLEDFERFGDFATIGVDSYGFCVVTVDSLVGGEEHEWTALLDAIRGHFDARAMLLDLRGNVGGNEERGRAIASLFADEERVYATRRRRSGPKPEDLGPAREVRIGPRGTMRYTKPVACLIDEDCVSSCEGFAQMMAVLPHVTLVGRPTRGASGNPTTLTLPNGVQVVYSTWINHMPDGRVLEGNGVPPDLVVEEAPGGSTDAVRAAAVGVLLEKLGR